jgi:GR25 family glycosyltransferase involved in LPS biosynthesis
MKAFIICLSEINSSITSARVLQKDLHAVGIDADLFEGSYGDIAQQQYLEHGRVCHPWSFKGPDQPYSQTLTAQDFLPGILGCFDSHYRLWQLCADLGDPIMIFEDDIEIVRGYQEVAWQDVLSLAFSHNKKMQKYLQYLDSPEGEPRAEHYRQASMPGNGGYALHPHAARVLVDTYAHTFLPADNAINQHVVKIEIHNYMMGRARDKLAGNISLTRSKIWEQR